MSKGLHLIREWETLRFEGDHIIFIVLRVCTIEKITTLQCFWLQPSMSLRLYWALVASNLDRRKRMMSCYQVSFYCIIIHPTHTLIEDVKPFIDSTEILHQNLFIVATVVVNTHGLKTPYLKAVLPQSYVSINMLQHLLLSIPCSAWFISTRYLPAAQSFCSEDSICY